MIKFYVGTCLNVYMCFGMCIYHMHAHIKILYCAILYMCMHMLCTYMTCIRIRACLVYCEKQSLSQLVL